MIRKNYKKILPILAVAFVAWFIQGHVAHAGLLNLNAWDFVWGIASNGAQVFLTMASWLVGVTGTLLNVSVYLTTHIGDFVNNSDVIFKVWGIIRDLASMILIFIILWAAMQMILGIKQANFSSLIFSIVIMGILINFSFFFARVMIDASNIATLEFYDAIAPGKPSLTPSSTIFDITNQAWQDRGLSDIFMGALSVTKWYDTGKVISANNDGSGGATTASTPLRIFLIGVGGIIVMIFASLSFIGAAAACILRLAVLIFLLAFSPIWVAAMAMPQLKKASDMWWGQFKAHLLFLPVYMMLMYVAIRILAESKLNMLAVSSQSGLASTGSMGDFTSLFVGFAIVLVMLNAPLIGAVSIAGAGSKLTESWFKGARGWAGGLLGRNTLGRAGARFDKWASNQKSDSRIVRAAGSLVGIGNSTLARDVRAITSKKLTEGKFGSGRSFKEQMDLNKDIAKKDKEIEHKKAFDAIFARAKANPALTSQMKDAVDKFNTKEKLALGPKTLKEISVLKHLKDDDFDAIKKSDDINDDDKTEIFSNRILALKDAVTNGETSVIKHMIQNMTGKDLMKLVKPGTSPQLTDSAVVANLKPSQLKVLDDEGLDATIKQNIGTQIMGWAGTLHPARGFIQRNRRSW